MVVVIALIVSVAFNVLLSVLVFRIADSGMKRLSESHERTTTHTADLVDRLMAVDYAAYQASLWARQVEGITDETTDEDEEKLVRVPGADRGGFGSRLGLSQGLHPVPDEDEEARLAATEEALGSELP